MNEIHGIVSPRTTTSAGHTSQPQAHTLHGRQSASEVPPRPRLSFGAKILKFFGLSTRQSRVAKRSEAPSRLTSHRSSGKTPHLFKRLFMSRFRSRAQEAPSSPTKTRATEATMAAAAAGAGAAVERQDSNTTTEKGRGMLNMLEHEYGSMIEDLNHEASKGGVDARHAKQQLRLYHSTVQEAKAILTTCEQTQVQFLSHDEKNALWGKILSLGKGMENERTPNWLQEIDKSSDVPARFRFQAEHGPNSIITPEKGRSMLLSLERAYDVMLDTFNHEIRQGGEKGYSAKQQKNLYQSTMKEAATILAICEQTQAKSLSPSEQNALWGNFKALGEILDDNYIPMWLRQH